MKRIVFILVFIICLSACQSTGVTKQQAFPKVYNERPQSILVLPAINKTTAADAASLYSTTIAQPLAEAGYYVFSIPYIDAYFANEGIIDGAQLSEIPASRYKELFGADSVLFVHINQWDTNYYVLGGNVTVGATFQLVSTRTGQILWQYHDTVVNDTSSDSGNLLIDMISTALTTSVVDYVPIARTVSQQIVRTLPVGHYHKNFNKDQGEVGVSEKSSHDRP